MEKAPRSSLTEPGSWSAYSVLIVSAFGYKDSEFEVYHALTKPPDDLTNSPPQLVVVPWPLTERRRADIWVRMGLIKKGVSAKCITEGEARQTTPNRLSMDAPP